MSEKVGVMLNVEGKTPLFCKYSDRRKVGLTAFYSAVPPSLKWRFQG
jgi:hypothetical protein